VTQYAGLVLLIIVSLDLYVLATSRLGACIRGSAAQGLALGILPFVVTPTGSTSHLIHASLIGIGTIALKAILIPWFLLHALSKTNVRREVEPFVSQHTSILLGAILVGIAFWTSNQLPLPRAETPALLVPIAFSTLFIGLLIVVSRVKAITQVIGYLIMENGIFMFGLTLTKEMPFVVELGILLDVLVGIFVFGIFIRHLSNEFGHIDVDVLSELKD